MMPFFLVFIFSSTVWANDQDVDPEILENLDFLMNMDAIEFVDLLSGDELPVDEEVDSESGLQEEGEGAKDEF